MLVPTSATSAPPKPNDSGTSMYSSRVPMPYPAIAAAPNAATSPVASAIVTLVISEVSDDSAPTRKMS